MRLFGLIVGVTGLAAVADGGERLVIVDRGATRYEIVTARDALPTTHLAASELQRFLHQASGVTLPIVSMASRKKRQIFITAVGGLKPHGFTIETRGKNIHLSGRDSDGSKRSVDYIDPIHRGTCNAVYEFLERFVGVRWFWGDELGDVVPKMSRITVPATINIKQEPFFDYRALPCTTRMHCRISYRSTNGLGVGIPSTQRWSAGNGVLERIAAPIRGTSAGRTRR